MLSLAIGFTSLLAATATAGVNQWTIIGPPHLEVQAMAIDPYNNRILYAAGFDTAARSDDAGATWTSTPVPELTFPSAIRVSPSLPSKVYLVGSFDVFRSTSSGNSWIKRKAPAVVQFPTDLQVDHSNSDVVVATAINFCLFGCSGGGVYRSDDGAGSWKRIGLKDTDVYSLALDPTSSKVIYVVAKTGLFRTSNTGDSWKLISPFGSGEIESVAVDPVVSTINYSGTQTGIYRSDNSGQSWTLIRPADYGSLIAAPTFGSRQLFVSAGGVALSYDGGFTWQELSSAGSGLQFNGLKQVAVSPSVCYMVSDIVGLPGQVLSYELLMPRRRTAER
jgi:photosystem II stability/assembly factor-like uncharacterized protein